MSSKLCYLPPKWLLNVSVSDTKLLSSLGKLHSILLLETHVVLCANFFRLKSKQPQSDGLIVKRFPLSFHCLGTTWFAFFLLWIKVTSSWVKVVEIVYNHLFKKMLLRKTSCTWKCSAFEWNGGQRVRKGEVHRVLKLSVWRPNRCMSASSINH